MLLGCGNREDPDGAVPGELDFLSAGGLYWFREGVFPLLSVENLPLLLIRAACSLQKLICLSAAFSLNLLWHDGGTGRKRKCPGWRIVALQDLRKNILSSGIKKTWAHLPENCH